MKNLYFNSILLFLTSFSLFAQTPGTLNPEFSQNGWDAIVGNNNGLYVNKILIQPDQKILICAAGYFPSEAVQAIIVRYNPDGTLDTTFGGGDGMVRSINDAEISIVSDASGMALQSDGKILVAGEGFGTNKIFRLNTDGTLDLTFGTDGDGVVYYSSYQTFIKHISVQSDNKIIICGIDNNVINNQSNNKVFLKRYTSNGAIDNTFGINGGLDYQPFFPQGNANANIAVNELLILPNDKIVVNQSYINNPNCYVSLRKFNTNGTADTTFGVDGEAVKSILTSGNDFISGYIYSSSCIQADGAILSTLTQKNNSNEYTESIFRFNSQGQLDNSLNITMNNLTFSPRKSKIATSGNKIYFLRKDSNFEPNGFSELRCYDLNGNLVSDFGANGLAVMNQNDIPFSIESQMAITDNGNIIIGSQKYDPDNPNRFFLVYNVVGYNPNLAIKTEFTQFELNLFPNPTTGLVSISNQDNLTIDKIEILDILGKTVSVKTDNTSQVDISNVANGIYIFKIYSGETVFQKKIIKQ